MKDASGQLPSIRTERFLRARATAFLGGAILKVERGVVSTIALAAKSYSGERTSKGEAPGGDGVLDLLSCRDIRHDETNGIHRTRQVATYT